MKDTTLYEQIKHAKAMLHIIKTSDKESVSFYCTSIAMPALKALKITPKSSTVKSITDALVNFIDKHKIGSKPTFRSSKVTEEVVDVSIPTAEWSKEKNIYSYYKNGELKGKVEVLDSHHDLRYKWSTDKGTGAEKYLYKAYKCVELST